MTPRVHHMHMLQSIVQVVGLQLTVPIVVAGQSVAQSVMPTAPSQVSDPTTIASPQTSSQTDGIVPVHM